MSEILSKTVIGKPSFIQAVKDNLAVNKVRHEGLLKQVIVPPEKIESTLKFFAEMKERREEAIKRIEARTAPFKKALIEAYDKRK